ncbi:endoglucanase 16 [Argentina anserina]|uniref:endoglucanase 16 n=1 Tax=Argentina anserina TaxID=57926 RepID=UPI0021766852|nr:endoglucanase 16 [Potentilla anserina]
MFVGKPSAIIVVWLALFQGLVLNVNAHLDYKDALTKSIIFLEAQRSGKLPPNHRLKWRGDSALDDGKLENVDLSGGYYDAGDNVKYGLPMAFTVTTLAWAAIQYQSELKATGELQNVIDGIKWGTDYFLKASVKQTLYVQVGDPNADHQCWVRPEDMKTPRTVYKINENTPGSEIAGETSAAMAAASIVFRLIDRAYARRLLNRAKLLFQMAKTHKGTYDGECPFYCSFSGYNDELLWAATWLYKATKRPEYLTFLHEEAITATVAEFSWDLKYAGAQILVAKMFFEGDKTFENYKNQADSFICSNIPASPYAQVKTTPSGMVHLRDGANTQYVTGTALLFSIYSDFLAQHNQKVVCSDKQFDSASLMAFAKKQIDLVLGDNPSGKSYMVGFGSNAPTQAHHRGASIPMGIDSGQVGCPMSFVYWYNKDTPNPNELTGAILGGPDINDQFHDKRWESAMTEPCTYVNSLAVGVLAKLATKSIA